MPNGCNNQLIFTNVTDDQTTRIINAVERGELMDEFFPEPDWRQTPNDDGVLPGPAYARWVRGSVGPARNWTQGSSFPDGTPDQRWYRWRTNQNHWGTKWGAYDCQYETIDGVIYVTFTTAWAPPSDAWMAKASAALPGAELQLRFEEPGCDFFGVTVARQGVVACVMDEPSRVQQAYFERVMTKEDAAIYADEEHELHDEIYDKYSDDYWDVASDLMSEIIDESLLIQAEAKLEGELLLKSK